MSTPTNQTNQNDNISERARQALTELEPNNDNITRALFFMTLFTPEDCARILALAEDKSLTEKFLAYQRQLMPGYSHYMRCRTQVVPMNENTNWLLQHLHTILMATNDRNYKFDAHRLMGTQILTLEKGEELDWNASLGGGIFASRKLMLVAFLTPEKDYTGGAFELMANIYASARRDQGNVAVFPAFSVCRFHPVTSGKLQVLVAWLHGDEQFS